MADLDPLLTLLRSVDTPTVCNAIEVIDGRRGFDAYTRGTPQASDPSGVIVGQARTARISAVAPPVEAPEFIRARRMDYYRHMAEGQGPRVAVVEDIDTQPVGAYWGELKPRSTRGLASLARSPTG